ncbi:MAG: hypothetical protein HQ523_16670 [Lentisphaerae bacterium]|nr:hypothetical protein [Lentisphaerota bacterium]
MHRPLLTLSVIALTLAPFGARSEPVLLGARALIERITAAVAQKEEKPDTLSPALANRKAIAERVMAFRKASPALPPADAAQQWLTLLDDFAALPREPRPDYGDFMPMDPFAGTLDDFDASSLSLSHVISALPGPESWAALDDAIAARPDETADARERNAALRVLIDFLRGRLDQTEPNLDTLSECLSERANNMFDRYYRGSRDGVKELRAAIRRTVGFNSKQEVIEDYRTLIAKPIAQTGPSRRIQVPDLCRLTTAEEARELLTTTLLLEGATPMVSSGGPTLTLLKEILIEEMENTKVPMWHLVTSPADTALYEALAHQYPQAKEEDTDSPDSLFMDNRSYWNNSSASERLNAQFIYVVGLIAEGRIDEAVAIAGAEKRGDRGYYRLNRLTMGMDQKEFASNMFIFLDRLLTDHGESRWWRFYVDAALMAKRSDTALARLTSALEDPALDISMRIVLLEKKAELDLGLGHIDRGIESLRAVSAIDLTALGQRDKSQISTQLREAAQTLSRLGLLLDRSALVDEGLACSAAVANQLSQDEDAEFEWYAISSSAEFLIEVERYAEAEAFILDGMVKALRAHAVQAAVTDSGPIDPDDRLVDLSSQLTLLGQIYAKLGRTDDVWYLLQELPWWGEPALPLENEILVVGAANALVAADRGDDAVALLKRFILGRPAADRAYEALISMQPPELVTWLDQLYARDRFEERPLIWKAVLFQKDGKLDEAEAVIRQALKVDPTDGETEAGQRVIAYGILGDILEAKGQDDDAAFFRSVVRSVRTAERGDSFNEVGLTSRSLELYEEAEEDFVDAYCVQWRLAERLHALGRYEEAEAHYEIAFKRMPEQFGRVASFCFGCSGVFQKEHSRSVAERILTHLLEEKPDNPQIHFLLGQLREAQDENALAYDHFRKAVEIDPQYLDAWERLYELSQSLFLPKTETDKMAIEALKLDPMQRHFGRELALIADMETVWTILAENQKFAVDEAGAKIELTATKVAVDKVAEKLGSSIQRANRRHYRYSRYEHNPINPPEPGTVLTQHKIVSELMGILAR